MTATIFSLSRQYPCWDAILRSLDLPTIKALRLAHRELAESCLTPFFLQHVASQTVELIPDDGGKALAELCDHPLSTHVKTLKIITNVYDKSIIEKSIQTGRDWTISPYAGRLRCSRTLAPREIESLHKEVLWLRERHDAEMGIADEEIIGRLARTFRRLKSLRALSLDARLCYGPGVYDSADRTASWPLVRQGASRLFELVIGAIGKSGVLIEELDAYWSRTGCAVSIDSLARSLQSVGQDGGADPWDAMRGHWCHPFIE
ncbi:hypothetical protein NLU13_5536 [Sarocladium strictum]|uniref:Uncharacterized protein n=1 Tax=Sarocladium strictum TaxID=5046 RepID=A0AA39GIE6_SARSR|nr:hypothetical protein NLU13_5536 [Sarocladium strictum]